MSRPSVRSLKAALALSAAASVLAGLAGSVAAETVGAPIQTAASAFPRSQPAQTPYASRSGAALAGAPSGAASSPFAARSTPLSGQTVRVDLSGPAQTRMLTLPRGKSAVIELPLDARDVLVSDPKVADVVLSTPRRIYVLGVGAGQTDATFFDSQGRQLLNLNIRVDQDITSLGETLNRVLPGGQVKVEAMGENLVLSGQVASAGDADKALRLAAGMVTKPEQVINMLSIASPEQVMLKVRIVEVSRSVIKQLGFNLNALTGQLGMPQYAFGNAPSYGVNGSFLGGTSGGYSVDTTSQPVSGFPFGSELFGGLSQASELISGANAAGIPISGIAGFVSQFLSGTGNLNGAQTSFVSKYLAGLVGGTSTDVTPSVINPQTGLPVAGVPYTVTAPMVGIGTNNIAQLQQIYLAGDPTNRLTGDQRLWLNAFNNKLPSYNAAAQYDLVAGQQSVFRDRSNPANFVQKGMAGSTGLNKAEAMLQAFERVGLVRTLAEPNLTAVSGESAKFLAGGEFPVPVGRDNNGQVTIQFKPYGVGLGFTPVVLSPGRISLRVSTEVSELSNQGAFALAVSSNASLTIPSLNVRRAETMVELPSGGAMMIAGLLQSKTKETLDSLPGLMQLPVLGALFRSRDFINDETELVVIVTPYLVKSTNPNDLQTPADGLQIASDLQTNLLGRLNRAYGKTPATTPEAAQGYQGPFGYVVE